MTEPLDPMRAIGTLLGLPEPSPEIAPVVELVVELAPPARRHAQDAEYLLDQAENDSGEPDALTLATMAVAQATLALAAQQRIANVIAWQAVSGEQNRAFIRRELEL